MGRSFGDFRLSTAGKLTALGVIAITGVLLVWSATGNFLGLINVLNFVLSEHSIQSRTTTNGSELKSEDIPAMASYFVDRYANRAGRKIREIRKSALDSLQSYSWPGNIRELQNVIERSLIFCETDEFTIDKSWLSGGPVPTGSADQALIETSAPWERGFWCKVLKGSVSCDNCRDDGTDLGTRSLQGTAL